MLLAGASGWYSIEQTALCDRWPEVVSDIA
jgi:hypothetical protein